MLFNLFMKLYSYVLITYHYWCCSVGCGAVVDVRREEGGGVTCLCVLREW